MDIVPVQQGQPCRAKNIFGLLGGRLGFSQLCHDCRSYFFREMEFQVIRCGWKIMILRIV